MKSLSSKQTNQPPPDPKRHGAWGRFTHLVSRHRTAARLVILTIGLVFYQLVLPPGIRIALWNSLQSHKILASMLLVFSLLAISLIWSTGQQLDAWVFMVFNVRGPRPAWLDRVMLGVTQLGSGYTAVAVALVVFVTGERLLSHGLVLGTLTLWLVVELVKFAAHRSRPHIRVAQARIVGGQNSGRSFPSGHTSQVFFIATLLAQYYHPALWVVLLLYAAALLVGITRMYVGAHYPRDVLAGAVLGSAWGLLGLWGN